MKKIPIGIADFKELIKQNHYFVDKTLFIKEILDDGAKVILFPRPRRFGKTLNLSMLKYFLEKTTKSNLSLFKNLAIYKDKKLIKQQGTHPVIFITFKDIKVSTWKKCKEKIKTIISKEYRNHKYLLKSNHLDKYEKKTFRQIIGKKTSSEEFEDSLKNLSEYLHRYYDKRAFILIDEYDTPIQEGFMKEYKDDVVDFMRNFLGGGLKDNNSLEKGVLTGILRIAKEDIFSGLNNLEVCTILSQFYSDKFGLLENEVRDLLKYYKIEDELKKIKSWYNGYRFGNKTVYNPWSILKLARNKGECAPYWVNTSQNSLINKILATGKDELKEEFELLISGKTIDKVIDEDIILDKVNQNPDVVWNLLLFSGYLTYNKKKVVKDDIVYSLKIPNREVARVFKKIIASWFGDSIGPKKYSLMLKNLINGDVESFEQILKEFLINSISCFDTAGKNPEKVYHALVLGMLVGLQDSYEIKSNRESGIGRYDVILIPKKINNLGIVIEFKVAKKTISLEKSAKEALRQIINKRYTQELIARKIKKHLLIGIAFKEKELALISKFI